MPLTLFTLSPSFSQKLDEQTSFFKTTIMSNVITTMKPSVNSNPCLKMWALLISNQIITHKLFE